MTSDAREGDIYTCPECGAAVSSADASPALQCPQCGAQFFKPIADAEEDVWETSDEEHAEPAADREAELSGLRIRQIAVLRRAAYRSRSYFIIGAAVCLAAVIDLAWTAVHLALTTHFRTGASSWLLFAGCIILVAPAAWGTWYFFARVRQTTRELDAPLLTSSTNSPDFSSLSDGTQHVKHLEEMGRAEVRDSTE